MQPTRFSSVSSTARRFKALGSGLAAAALAASLAACSSAPPQNYAQTSYPVQSTQSGYAATAQPVQMAEYGRVAQIEVVRTQEKPRTSGAGAIIGGVAGAVIGHQIGAGFGRDVATLAGAAGGAVAGNSIEKNRNGNDVSQVYRVSVQLDNGPYRAYDINGGIDLRVGDRVRIENGQISRS